MNNNLEKTSKKQIDISKYQNVEDFDLKKLSFGLWWVKNKQALKITLIIFLVIISLFTLVYTVFNWSKYFLVFRAEDEAMVKELVLSKTVSESFLRARAPKNISVSALAISSTENMYDLHVAVQNHNQDYYGTISYCFIFNSVQTDCRQTFILPNQKKYILSLANDLGAFPGNANFKIEGISWSRIDRHDIYDWQNFYERHLDFEVRDVLFEKGEGSELSEKLNINLLTFSIRNKTAYDYYEVPLNLILFSRGRVVGVSRYVLRDFDSNKDESVRIVWPGIVDPVTNIEISPDLDISRDDIYQN